MLVIQDFRVRGCLERFHAISSPFSPPSWGSAVRVVIVWKDGKSTKVKTSIFRIVCNKCMEPFENNISIKDGIVKTFAVFLKLDVE